MPVPRNSTASPGWPGWVRVSTDVPAAIHENPARPPENLLFHPFGAMPESALEFALCQRRRRFHCPASSIYLSLPFKHFAHRFSACHGGAQRPVPVTLDRYPFKKVRFR